ncbi:MAG: hypothetical protein AAF570_23330, partial [Bacteroidota bacterium]
MALDTKGNVYLWGRFSFTVDADPGPGTFNMTSNGGGDVFIQKIDTSRNLIWAEHFGGVGFEDARTISLDLQNVIVAGSFRNSVDFDNGPAQANLSSFNASYDMFVMKLDDCTPTDSNLVVMECDQYMSPSGLLLSATGIYQDTLLNAGGCDSILTIDLTILQSSANTLTETACNSYLSPAGQLYTTSGTYTETILNSAGCDSNLTIQLTIVPVDTSVNMSGNALQATASGATFQWLDCNANFAPVPNATSSTFLATQPGSYAVEVTENGCTDTSACYT